MCAIFVFLNSWLLCLLNLVCHFYFYVLQHSVFKADLNFDPMRISFKVPYWVLISVCLPLHTYTRGDHTLPPTRAYPTRHFFHPTLNFINLFLPHHLILHSLLCQMKFHQIRFAKWSFGKKKHKKLSKT